MGAIQGMGFINYLGSLSRWTQADLYGVDEIHSNSRKGSTGKIVCLFKRDEKKYVKQEMKNRTASV